MRNILVFLLMIPLILEAQTRKLPSGNAIGIGLMSGHILVHTTKIHNTIPAISNGIEFSYKKQTIGKKDWHQRFGFPEIAINGFLALHGNSQLGHAWAIYPSIQFRILNIKDGYWFWKVGGGIGWNSSHWQRLPSEDTMNNILGSAVNNFTMFQTGIRYPIKHNLTVQAGIDFYHLSNAAARTPNYGINTFGLNIGMNYHPSGIVQHFEKRKLRHHVNSFNLCVSNSIAFAEDKTPDGPMYPVYTGGLSIVQMYRNKNRIILGGDAIYNWRTRAIIHNGNQLKDGLPINAWQFTSFIGHEFLFGRVGVPIIAGAYLNRPVGGNKIYQKLGMVLHFYHPHGGTFKDAQLSLMLKTHLIQAQYAELGFGFYL